jgi:hypothetical protein
LGGVDQLLHGGSVAALGCGSTLRSSSVLDSESLVGFTGALLAGLLTGVFTSKSCWGSGRTVTAPWAVTAPYFVCWPVVNLFHEALVDSMFFSTASYVHLCCQAPPPPI